MTVEQIKEKILDAETSCVSEIMDYMDGGKGEKVDVLVMDVYPKRNVEKALKELDIREYIISDDNTVTYTTWL